MESAELVVQTRDSRDWGIQFVDSSFTARATSTWLPCRRHCLGRSFLSALRLFCYCRSILPSLLYILPYLTTTSSSRSRRYVWRYLLLYLALPLWTNAKLLAFTNHWRDPYLISDGTLPAPPTVTTPTLVFFLPLSPSLLFSSFHSRICVAFHRLTVPPGTRFGCFSCQLPPAGQCCNPCDCCNARSVRRSFTCNLTDHCICMFLVLPYLFIPPLHLTGPIPFGQ